MPWSATDPAKERIEVVLEWERRWDADPSELCRELGVSRQTAHVWIRRMQRPPLIAYAASRRRDRAPTGAEGRWLSTCCLPAWA